MTRLSTQTARSGFYPLSSLFWSDAEAQEQEDVAFTQDVLHVRPEKMSRLLAIASVNGPRPAVDLA